MTAEEAKEALLKSKPARYKETEYHSVNAITYRLWRGRLCVFVELLDKSKNSVTVVPMADAELIK